MLHAWATALYSSGRLTEALDAQQKAVQLKPKNKEMADQLGRCEKEASHGSGGESGMWPIAPAIAAAIASGGSPHFPTRGTRAEASDSCQGPALVYRSRGDNHRRERPINSVWTAGRTGRELVRNLAGMQAGTADGIRQIRRHFARRVCVRDRRRRSVGDGRGAGGGFRVLQRQQLLTVDRHVSRRLDAQPDLAPVDVHHGDADIFADVNLLTQFAAQDQHVATLLRAIVQWLTCSPILRHEACRRCQGGVIFVPAGLPPDPGASATPDPFAQSSPPASFLNSLQIASWERRCPRRPARDRLQTAGSLRSDAADASTRSCAIGHFVSHEPAFTAGWVANPAIGLAGLPRERRDFLEGGAANADSSGQYTPVRGQMHPKWIENTWGPIAPSVRLGGSLHLRRKSDARKDTRGKLHRRGPARVGGLCGGVKHCLAQLDEGQVWQRPRPAMNSVGNLLLHLSGNLRQRLLSVVGGAADDRDRPREFSERGPLPKAELLFRLEEAAGGADAVLAGLTAGPTARMEALRRPARRAGRHGPGRRAADAAAPERPRPGGRVRHAAPAWRRLPVPGSGRPLLPGQSAPPMTWCSSGE